MLNYLVLNLRTAQLISLFSTYFDEIIFCLQRCDLVEVQENVVIPHIESHNRIDREG